ncbi:coenzyme F420 hydrogenase/dehydrogenase beta subunit N-terminal domain-containing protein [Roseospira visakhapatnamensis]|uniref:Coenzyme F420 hydrogenase subunit beta n=1 Tax=Roseospira visakhapatnamensis TaxID=390880 RepID=A0A7W6RGY9_9PROT|nr:coenzyme F420 hydrogenase/dehydrogenase beta subunit N-terminal domain-containing protein [Roseospira visakhapatnamensis]MBB4267811.1 coenzyme F420 hydrogenase subunit beta [Roseospira visakhapatnamensis]
MTTQTSSPAVFSADPDQATDPSRPSSPWTPPLREPLPRLLCTDCGLSRTDQEKACGRACQFIRPDYATLERRVHGRPRDPRRADEVFFGPFRRMVRAALKEPRPGAQWTGITTRIGQRLLETDAVDAVLCVTADPDDRWRPRPVLVTRAEDMAACRGMRMGYAPLLALLQPAREAGIRRLAVIGIPCQVHALRVLERDLGFERLYVIGTPCSDNTTTENFHTFLGLLTERPAEVTYLEFRADYCVELRFTDGTTRLIPFLKLPISKLPRDFFPLPCRTCVDYTNALADITVGYLAGRGKQWLLVRNERGEDLLGLLGDEVAVEPLTSAGHRTSSVQGFITNTERAAGGMPVRGMPNWLRPLMAVLMPRVGPRGLEIARARLEMKAAETVIHLRREQPLRMKAMIPPHVWTLVEPYGLTPKPGERPE